VTNTGNTEGTPQPGDSVETGRGAPANWDDVQEIYKRTGTIKGVAEHYGVGRKKARAELARRGVEIVTPQNRVIDWSNLHDDYERIGNILRVAKHYGVRFDTVRDEMIRQGIPIKPRGHVKGQKKSEAWRCRP